MIPFSSTAGLTLTPLLSSNTHLIQHLLHFFLPFSLHHLFLRLYPRLFLHLLFLRLLSQHFLYLHLPTPLSSMQSVVLGAWLWAHKWPLNNCDLPRCKPLVIRPLLFTVIWCITYDVSLSLRSGYIVVREQTLLISAACVCIFCGHLISSRLPVKMVENRSEDWFRLILTT